MTCGNVLDLLYCYYLQKRENDLSGVLKEKVKDDRNVRVEQWVEYLLGNFDDSGVLSILEERVWPYKKYLSKEQLSVCIMVAACNNKLEMVKEIVALMGNLKQLRLEMQLIVRIALEII